MPSKQTEGITLVGYNKWKLGKTGEDFSMLARKNSLLAAIRSVE